MITLPSKKRGRGRPTTLTPETSEIIVQAVRLGAPLEMAAKYAGVGERSLFRWVEDGKASEDDENIYRQLWHQIEQATAENCLRSLQRLQQAAEGEKDGLGEWIRKPEWKVDMELLARKYPKDFGLKRQVELTGADGGPVEVEFKEIKKVTDEMSDEELKVLTRIGQKLYRPELTNGTGVSGGNGQ